MDTKHQNAKQAAFACITLRSKVYQDYFDVDSSVRTQTYHMALMMHRWDGRLGFYGGFLENGETHTQCVIREIEQEANLFLTEEKLQPLCSSMIYLPPKGDALAVETYHYDLGEFPIRDVKLLIKKIADAPHCVVEGTPVLVHLAKFGDGWGFPITTNANNLAPTVYDSLKLLTKKLGLP